MRECLLWFFLGQRRRFETMQRAQKEDDGVHFVNKAPKESRKQALKLKEMIRKRNQKEQTIDRGQKEMRE